MLRDVRSFLKFLGPGLLLAASATGVSHLVQSTRAGAVYGYALIPMILLANLFKYPFFLYGPRYSASTGKSLIEGYQNLGKGYFYTFLFLTLATMFIIQGAITLVTAGIATQLFPGGFSATFWSIALLLFCVAILLWGEYSALDLLTKVVVVLLVISTIWASAGACSFHLETAEGFVPPSPWTSVSFPFIIALMGWMPAPIDLSVWNSLWTHDRRSALAEKPTLKQESVDFHVGYIGTAILALFFVSLGACVMHGRGVEIERSAGGFSKQLIDLYVVTFGERSKPLIATLALTTMFSTVLTALDAYARVCRRCYSLVRQQAVTPQNLKKGYRIFLILTALGTVLVLTYFRDEMLHLVDIATILSFLSAPVLAYMNLKVIRSPEVSSKAQPSRFLTLFSYLGIAFLLIFSLIYITMRLSFI